MSWKLIRSLKLCVFIFDMCIFRYSQYFLLSILVYEQNFFEKKENNAKNSLKKLTERDQPTRIIDKLALSGKTGQ